MIGARRRIDQDIQGNRQAARRSHSDGTSFAREMPSSINRDPTGRQQRCLRSTPVVSWMKYGSRVTGMHWKNGINGEMCDEETFEHPPPRR